MFIYFNYVGFKNQGFGGYLKSFVPSGVPGVVAPVIWVIEVFSSFLRIFTLAVRLFANMYAGLIILGIFAILTSGFFTPIANMPEAVQHISLINPLRYFMEIVRGIMMKGSSLTDLTGQVRPLVAYGLTIFTLAASRFRKRTA